MDSAFLGRTRAIDILEEFCRLLKNIGLQKLISVSMDGPITNWLFLTELCKLRDEQQQPELMWSSYFAWSNQRWHEGNELDHTANIILWILTCGSCRYNNALEEQRRDAQSKMVTEAQLKRKKEAALLIIREEELRAQEMLKDVAKKRKLVESGVV